jgi:chromate transporter
MGIVWGATLVSGVVWTLFVTFSTVSIFAIGGPSALLPEFHRQIVEQLGLMTDEGFVHSVVLSQLAPGPNMLFISFIGWQVAGLSGLLVSTAALLAPTGLLAFAVGRVMEGRRDAAWVKAVKTSLAPIVVGLTVASALVTTRAADHDWVGLGLTAVSAGFMVAFKRNPLWVIGAGALIGILAHRAGWMALT